MKKKVGVLGGSFDPIHFGHLNLALSLKEAVGLQQVFIVPARCSPFKESCAPVASAQHRLMMVQEAVKGMSDFTVLDWELNRPAPSYTIDTIRQLSADPSLEVHLLLAEDHVPTFFSWKEAEELIRLASPLIGTRHKKTPLSCPWGTVIETPCFEISSTRIRERLRHKLYCGHLVPLPVLIYIQQHQLYAFNDH